MTDFALELHRCKTVLALRAVLDAGGNICAAARATGVHRNTFWRVLHRAGYNSRSIKRLVAQRIAEGWRKQPQAVPIAVAADREVA
jgi:transposase-like protein